MNRAYSILEIRSTDDDKRVIEGIASTPSPDRYGDVVEPMGAKFALPMPLLWQHRADEPVGHVEFAKPTKDGIPFRARIAKIDEPGELKDLCDKAWQAVKAKLVSAVSIGFSAIEYAFLKDGGIHFQEWEWLELSLVTIPANADATIQNIKSIDAASLALSGRTVRSSDRPQRPDASGKSIQFHKPKPTEAKVNVAEKIKDFESTLAAKQVERQGIQEKASNEGRSKDESERETFTTLTDEIKALSDEIADLRILEKENIVAAKPVGAASFKDGSESRDVRVVVKHDEKLEPGIEFTRFAMCVAASKGNVRDALTLHELHYPKQVRGIAVLKAAARSGASLERYLGDGMEALTKNAIAAGTTAETTWAAPLLDYNVFTGDFIDYLRPRTIIGQFGQNGVPALNRIPFNVHIKGATTGGTGYWVGQGKPKPVTKFDFNDAYHPFHKVANITVLTEELIRFSNPSAERLVRDLQAGSLIARIDTTFIDPTLAASAGVSPASITNGVSASTASGTDGDAVRADLAALWSAAIAANLPLTDAVYITTPSVALNLSLMMNALGQAEFPAMTVSGGTLRGVPVIVSNHVPAGTLVLVFASEIYLSDDGAVTIDASREASIQMLDNPTNASSDGTATTMVSMFQTNSVALRAERFITWSKRRSTAVALVEDINWGGIES